MPLVRAGDIRGIQTSPSIRQSQSGAQVVLAFFESINDRDFNSLLHLLADSIVQSDLSHTINQEGKLSVANFYQDLMIKADGVRFQVEDITEGSDSKVGVTWQIFLDNQAMPLGRGLGFYTLNPQGEITSIRQSPEHFIKSADQFKAALNVASPVFRALAPIFLPAQAQAPAQQMTSASFQLPPSMKRDPPALRSAGQWGIDTGLASSSSVVKIIPSLIDKDEWSSVVQVDGSSGHSEMTQHYLDESSLATFQVDLNGTWKKALGQDTAAFEKALDLWQLSFLQKTAARLIEGVEIIQTHDNFTIGMFVAQIPQFKINESYTIGGAESKVMRRDMRAGNCTATTVPLPNGIEFTSVFGPPLPGKLLERYILLSPGLMEVTSSVSISGKVAEAVLIYELQQ